ncbi:MAG: tetratricopeptide repeat protein [Lachnospiraceae bacterium]|nr:tetratricopeptide repeat protein [Lachnospiraceae bacterium]
MKKVITLIVVLLCVSMSLLACGGKNTGTGDNKQTQAQMSWQEQYELGIRLLNEGKYEDAILAFQAAIQIDPKNVDAYLSLAEVHMQMGNSNKAQSVLQDGVDRCGEGSYDIFISIATKYEIILNVGGQEMTEETMTWDEYIEKGDQLIADGDYDAAIRAYEDAIAQEEEEPEPYIGIAKVHAQKGEIDKAIAVLQQGYDACRSDYDRDKILEYAKELGYVLDDNGELVKFDEEAFLANASIYEQLDYFMNKGNNADHWCFEQGVLLDGVDSRNITLEDVAALSVRMGWGEMTRSVENDSQDVVKTEWARAVLPFASAYRYLDSPGTAFENLLVGLESINTNIPAHYNQHIVDGWAAKPAVGIYDIHIGDSLESVLASLGWEYADEIGAVIRASEASSIGDYDQWYRRVDVQDWTKLNPGEKEYEQIAIQRMNTDVRSIEIRCTMDFAEGDTPSRGISVEFYFDPTEGYILRGIALTQWAS